MGRSATGKVYWVKVKVGEKGKSLNKESDLPFRATYQSEPVPKVTCSLSSFVRKILSLKRIVFLLHLEAFVL